MSEFLRIAARANFMVDGIDFYIVENNPHERTRRIAKSIPMEPLDEAVSDPPAPFWLTHNNAKKLMDDLWNAGVRPTEMSATEGALAATKDHLADMRDIAFRSIDDHYILNVQDKTIDE